MSMEYRILPAENLLVVRHTGLRKLSDAPAFFRMLAQDKEYSVGMHSIADARAMTGGEVETSELVGNSLRVSMMKTKVPDPVKQALIAPYGSPGFDMMQRYAAFAATNPNLDVRRFDTPAEALEWLGLTGHPDTYLETGDWKLVIDVGQDTIYAG